MATLTGGDIAALDLTGWVFLQDGLQTRVTYDDYAAGADLVAAIAALAIDRDHHPDLDLRYGYLDIRLSSHDVGGVTGRDVAMARDISGLVANRRLTQVDRLSRLELALNTPDFTAIAPFWAAVLAGKLTDDGTQIEDPDGVLPTLWFQAETRPSTGAEAAPSGTASTDGPALRWHLDLYLPPEHLDERMQAALAAGGTLVDESFVPSWWVLADAEGNTICLCTWQSPADGEATPSVQ